MDFFSNKLNLGEYTYGFLLKSRLVKSKNLCAAMPPRKMGEDKKNCCMKMLGTGGMKTFRQESDVGAKVSDQDARDG
jgi:hypothetical protein